MFLGCISDVTPVGRLWSEPLCWCFLCVLLSAVWSLTGVNGATLPQGILAFLWDIQLAQLLMSCFGCLWSAVRVNKQRSVPWCPLVLLFRLAVLPFWQVTLTTPLVLQIPPWMDGKEWGRTAILLFSTSVMSSS